MQPNPLSSISGTIMWRLLWGVSATLLLPLNAEAQSQSSSANYPRVTIKFNSASGLEAEDRVLARGATVGSVASTPRLHIEGRSVLVDVKLASLSPNHRRFINRHMTASIEPDGRDTKAVVLHFSRRPAPPLSEGAVISGTHSFVELWTWKVVHEFAGTGAPYERAVGLVFPTDAETVGIGVHRANAVGFVLMLAVAIGMAAEGIFKLLGMRSGKHSSPGLLLILWQLFVLFLGAKAVFILAALCGEVLGIPVLPDLRPWAIVPANTIQLIQWDLRFGIAAVALIVLRFNASLLGLVVRRP